MKTKSTNAIEKSASLCSPDEYDISLATAVVRNLTLVKSPGIFATLPATIITAIASPIALPIPSTTDVKIPLFAAGTTTLNTVSVLVAPSASDASSYSLGTLLIAVSDTEITDGRIITVSTIIAEKRFAPSGRLNVSLTRGTITIIPTRPYTTDGMPDSKSTALLTTPEILGLDIFARNIAHIIPIGTPIMIAPQVPYMELKINGRIPYDGVCAVDAHVVPNRKSIIPISLIAGKPLTTRNPVIRSTNAIVRNPQTVKIQFIALSNTTDAFLTLLIYTILSDE